ncbi:zinc finger protein 395a [Acanthochromis polyacanthus]|uniref:zinc finger protein 395a n=1 Tax=Acanthochromis polyacanthus TaxID=80966 RepID=UPI00223474EB|nr:zinc finger protein 395a [Acanthochromis polyacanthus]
MLPKTRLGKRSPLGALLSATCPTHTHLETGETDVTMATAAGQQASSRSRVHPGLKVYFQCAGEPSGVDQIDGPLSSPSCRSVSSCIDVPKSEQRPQEVDMDELMAAMVLSSLSCSPLLQSPTHPDTTAPAMDCGGSDFSDSGSSGYWSVGHAPSSPMPSPPIAEPDAGVVPPTDEGLDMELEQVLFDEPAPRKRRNSVKAAFRCLWPSCGKVLTSVVGIKRHIRTTHLCRGGEHERCSRSEEDFYYTEINQWEQPLCQSPPTPLLCGPVPSSFSPPSPPPLFPPPPSPSSPSSPSCGALSSSAPSSSGSFWQVQSEHSYQAPPPPGQVVSAAPLTTPTFPGTAPPTTCHKQGVSFRVRSVSVGEQWLQHHSAPCRRVRGEAKKCRKVYGIEHREQWCTACRWKKACQRFTD